MTEIGLHLHIESRESIVDEFFEIRDVYRDHSHPSEYLIDEIREFVYWEVIPKEDF